MAATELSFVVKLRAVGPGGTKQTLTVRLPPEIKEVLALEKGDYVSVRLELLKQLQGA